MRRPSYHGPGSNCAPKTAARATKATKIPRAPRCCTAAVYSQQAAGAPCRLTARAQLRPRVHHLSSARTPAAVLPQNPTAAGQGRRTPPAAAVSCSRLLGGARAGARGHRVTCYAWHYRTQGGSGAKESRRTGRRTATSSALSMQPAGPHSTGGTGALQLARRRARTFRSTRPLLGSARGTDRTMHPATDSLHRAHVSANRCWNRG